jgi:transposase
MGGCSRIRATGEERALLAALARSGKRGEADRARAVLLSLDGRSSAMIGRALRVRADTVRAWRCTFARGGAKALRARPRPGRPGGQGNAALACARAILTEPGEAVWTLPRLKAEIARRAEVSISTSRLSRLLRQRGASPGAAPGTPSRAGRTRTPSSARAYASGC